MENLFINDRLNLDAFAEPARSTLVELLGVRATARAASLGPLSFIVALGQREPERLERLLKPAMRGGKSPGEMVRGLLDYLVDPDAPPIKLGPLMRGHFDADGLALLAELYKRFQADGPAVEYDAAISELLRLIAQHVVGAEATMLSYLFDVRLVASGGLAGLSSAAPCGERKIFSDIGALDAAALTEPGIELIRAALRLAMLTGHDRCQVTHLVAACLDSNDSRVQQVLRVYGRLARLREARTAILERLRREYPGPELPPVHNSFAPACQILLDRLGVSGKPVGPGALLLGVLENADLDPFARDALAGAPLGLDIAAAAAFLRRQLEERDEPRTASPAAELPPGLTGLENLTAPANDPALRLVRRPESERLERALYARDVRGIVVHGERGTGRSSLVEEVARRATTGAIPFLRDAVFLRIDAGTIEEPARTTMLQRVMTAAGDDRRIILVVENFAALAMAAPVPLRQLLERPAGMRLIGVATTAEFTKVFADQALAVRLLGIDVPETDHAQTVEILGAATPALEREYGVRVNSDDLVRIAQLAASYLSSEPAPRRAVQLLGWACDEAGFEDARAVRPGEGGRADYSHAARALAHRLHLDEEEVLGKRGSDYYREQLEKVVVGQPEAIAAAARQILLARSGARSRERTAGVLMFAGQTGTGKTLLAKAMARLYCRSGTLHLFDMGTYSASHDVKRLIGAPPSYVGYDEGGDLVNRLLKDPNAVFLFDEVEKAHPSLWNSFLQLFAEGRIEDSRRQVARAHQALFVLTSNLCQEVINEGLERGWSTKRIEEQTLEAMRAARRPETGEPYFRPELFARLDSIIVFRPLSPDSLREIALLEIEKGMRALCEARSILLESAQGDWTALAEYLTGLCRESPDHGRALERAFRRLVTTPIIDYHRPDDREMTFRVAVKGDGQGGEVVLYGPSGQPLPARRDER